MKSRDPKSRWNVCICIQTHKKKNLLSLSFIVSTWNISSDMWLATFRTPVRWPQGKMISICSQTLSLGWNETSAVADFTQKVAAECGEAPSSQWSEDQAAKMLMFMRNLTETLYKHQMKGRKTSHMWTPVISCIQVLLKSFYLFIYLF